MAGMCLKQGLGFQISGLGFGLRTIVVKDHSSVGYAGGEHQLLISLLPRQSGALSHKALKDHLNPKKSTKRTVTT